MEPNPYEEWNSANIPPFASCLLQLLGVVIFGGILLWIIASSL